MAILERVIVRGQTSDQAGLSQKEKLRQMKDLRFSLNHQTDEACFEFIKSGGIDVLSRILLDPTVNMQVQEEAVWSITNLSFYSSQFEGEFQVAAQALLQLLRVGRIDNLAAILNLKQQCIQALGNLAIDSAVLRGTILGLDGSGMKLIVDLIMFNRAPLSEQCFWTINNFLLSDRQCSQLLIQADICKAIVSTWDRIKTKPQELMSELTWTINYLLDFDEVSVLHVFSQIPHLLKRLTSELEFEGDRLQQSPTNRPIIRILGNLLTIPSLPQDDLVSELVSDDRFQTFMLTVLLNKPSTGLIENLSQQGNLYKKECLWLLSNILGTTSEQNFEIMVENKVLVDCVCSLANSSTDYGVRKEALVTIYNMCENYQSKYLPRIMPRNPQEAFFTMLNHYETCDPYTLQVVVSFCTLICEKYGEEAVQSIIASNTVEMIENIKYKYSENAQLVAMVNSLLDTYIYKQGNEGFEEIEGNKQSQGQPGSFSI
ncbi:hypothetical protein FGO68_gene17177 [Halteria grandinella]|uniref:Importin subunit alpha n=1 Tax=Halteria grandinella TaxID=5974 RepID=A0A8J8T345_HALGN|nr:hypothetical protein FGO68_gene17177 [Halteria grandinella]